MKTFTDEEFAALLETAEAEIALWESALQVQPGPGLLISPDGDVQVDPRLLRPRPQADAGRIIRRPSRYAESLVIEIVQGNRIKINLPPIYGAVPTINGTPIYNQPSPTLRMLTSPQVILARIEYDRTGVSIPRTDPEDDSVTVGLEVAAISVDIVQQPLGSSTTPLTPSGGDGLAPPYPGHYREWLSLGSVQDGVAYPSFSVFSNSAGWGGTSLRTLMEFGETEWQFFKGVTYP